MQEVPHLTETAIRERASAQSWARGLDYFDRGNVIDVIWRDGLLVAQVWGSAYEPYRVQVSFDEDRIRFVDCNCPYDWGGDCKHIIAVLLHLVHAPDSVEQRPSVTALLADLSRDELVDLIVELARVDPQFVDDLEHLILQARVAENN